MRDINQHDRDVIERFRTKKYTITKWERHSCTLDYAKTDAFGDIIFLGASQIPSKYIRVSYRTIDHMDKILSLLFDKPYWSLSKPRLLISVTGGAKLNLNKRLKETFSKSLVEVATTTHALITTGGSYNGCMKLVGEAFKENALSIDPSKKVVVLGIANWCSVTKYESLIREEKSRSPFVEYEMIKPKNQKTKAELLDPNHSHFILVDDGKHDFGGEVEFRAELESRISKMQIDKETATSMVVLVVGGGPRTVEMVLNTVQKGNPCVFLESSGECANIYAFALKKLKSKDKKEGPLLDAKLKDEIKSRVAKEYPARKPIEIENIYLGIEKSLDASYAHLLNVCSPINGNAEIDVAILRALLRKEKLQFQSQLELALNWNRIDIARNFIFTDENKDFVCGKFLFYFIFEFFEFFFNYENFFIKIKLKRQQENKDFDLIYFIFGINFYLLGFSPEK
jgi:hypothetical protein